MALTPKDKAVLGTLAPGSRFRSEDGRTIEVRDEMRCTGCAFSTDGVANASANAAANADCNDLACCAEGDLPSRSFKIVSIGAPARLSPARGPKITEADFAPKDTGPYVTRVRGLPMVLPHDASVRKGLPITEGVLDYFPRAIAAVAACSKAGNDQHNPGQPLHWAKAKSTDHANCIARHLIDRFAIDDDGQRHAAKLAWRALALLETLLQADADIE